MCCVLTYTYFQSVAHENRFAHFWVIHTREHILRRSVSDGKRVYLKMFIAFHLVLLGKNIYIYVLDWVYYPLNQHMLSFSAHFLILAATENHSHFWFHIWKFRKRGGLVAREGRIKILWKRRMKNCCIDLPFVSLTVLLLMNSYYKQTKWIYFISLF